MGWSAIGWSSGGRDAAIGKAAGRMAGGCCGDGGGPPGLGRLPNAGGRVTTSEGSPGSDDSGKMSGSISVGEIVTGAGAATGAGSPSSRNAGILTGGLTGGVGTGCATGTL